MNQPSNPPQDEKTALENRYRDLWEKKIAADTNLKNSQEDLDALKEQARKAYGTDDLTALRDKLSEMQQENARKLDEYGQHLTHIEQQLAEVEAEHTKA